MTLEEKSPLTMLLGAVGLDPLARVVYSTRAKKKRTSAFLENMMMTPGQRSALDWLSAGQFGIEKARLIIIAVVTDFTLSCTMLRGSSS